MRVPAIAWPALLLTSMMALVSALGMPTEELLQDTFKSTLVCGFTLAAGYAWLWRARHSNVAVTLHPLLLIALTLLLHALTSMVWSHSYLGGVEAVRWFLLGLLLLIGLQVWSLPALHLLAWGIHLGATLAALWAALQFWFDWRFFVQGPSPASTFVNRNFFAEYLVCALPYTVLLMTRVRRRATVTVLTFVLAFQITALLMAGTRSGLLALLLLVCLGLIVLVRQRGALAAAGWRAGPVSALLGLALVATLALASVPTRLPEILAEAGPVTALERSLQRGHTLVQGQQYAQGSFAMRLDMWRSTLRMIADRPLAGVGAGAWEVEVPRYQSAGTQLETDYYAHNEPLQLLAEYGLTGLTVLLALTAYWLRSVQRTWRLPAGDAEVAPRWTALASLLALAVVSCAGFPLRLAATGALVAVSLGVLGASDGRRFAAPAATLRPRIAHAMLTLLAVVTGLALYVAWQAAWCEQLLVRSAKAALAINQSPDPRDPRWTAEKQALLNDVRRGIAINPHYRKLTPIVADAAAAWGDWASATWIWESVLRSRPNIAVLCANVARGYLQMGDVERARGYVQRALTLQGDAPAVRSLQVMLWMRDGHEARALARTRELLLQGSADYDLLQAAVTLGQRLGDHELAITALQQIARGWPTRAIDARLRLGALYEQLAQPDHARQSYAQALELAPPWAREQVLARVPPSMRAASAP